MPLVGHINASWTPAARAALERFVSNSSVSGAILSLSKKDRVQTGSRWLYTVYSGERLKPMRTMMEARGYPLLYELDGITVAISDPNSLKDLEAAVIDLGGPGYLLAQPPSSNKAPH